MFAFCWCLLFDCFEGCVDAYYDVACLGLISLNVYLILFGIGLLFGYYFDAYLCFVVVLLLTF